MCLVEAIACGLPIATTNSGAIPEVVGDATLISHHSNIRGLKTNLEKLITNESLRNTLSKSARKRAEERFDHLKIVEQIENVYQTTYSGFKKTGETIW